MRDWNEKNYNVLNYKKFVQQIENYVDWIFKKDSKAGCKYFKDFCITGCRFKEKRRIRNNEKASQETVVTISELEEFLTKYEYTRHPRDCAIVYKIMDSSRISKGLSRSETLYISFKNITRELQKYGYSGVKPMFACRRVKELTDTGLVEKVEEGKKGTFFGLANGYTFKTPTSIIAEKASLK